MCYLLFDFIHPQHGGEEMLRITQISEEDHRELRRMTRHEKGSVVLRAQLILWAYHDQESVPPLARRIGWTQERTRHWIHRFLREGPSGLYDRPGRGRSTKQTLQVKQALSDALDEGTPPAHTGYTCWTLALLVSFLLLRFGLRIHPSTLRRWIHPQFHWQRPQTEPVCKDPAGEAKLRRITHLVQTVEAPDVLLYQDETTLRLLPVIRGMWMRIGKQYRIPTGSGWNTSIKVFGALHAHTGAWTYQIFDTCNGEHFIRFLETLLATYPQGTIYIILDQASWHRAQRVQEWLDSHPRIQLQWLPTGCPKLNPVERIWGKLKDQVAANRWHGTLGVIRRVTEHFLDALSPEKASRIARLAA